MVALVFLRQRRVRLGCHQPDRAGVGLKGEHFIRLGLWHRLRVRYRAKRCFPNQPGDALVDRPAREILATLSDKNELPSTRKSLADDSNEITQLIE
jgi:hypothetical protein